MKQIRKMGAAPSASAPQDPSRPARRRKNRNTSYHVTPTTQAIDKTGIDALKHSVFNLLVFVNTTMSGSNQVQRPWANATPLHSTTAAVAPRSRMPTRAQGGVLWLKTLQPGFLKMMMQFDSFECWEVLSTC